MKDTDFCRECVSERNSALKKRLPEDCTLRGALEELSRISTELSMSETLEKFRLASEIKDNIGQLILLARINLDLLSDAETPKGYASALDTVRNLLDQALNGIRAFSSSLSPPLLAENGLEFTLKYLCMQMENDFGFEVKFTDDGSEKPLGDMSRSIIVYHVTQEILFNVARHAKESGVQLSIGRTGDMLQLVVEDLGARYDFSRIVSDHRKMGRLNIYDCIQQLGGEISFTSSHCERSGITIRAPLEEP